MTTWADEYVTLLEDCEKRSERLSDWECGFVDSLQRQLAEGRRPTPKQIETLDELVGEGDGTRMTPNGAMSGDQRP